jgi:AcrR family transcriptional regulator
MIETKFDEHLTASGASTAQSIPRARVKDTQGAILKAAFFVWGSTFYQKSSLSDLAAALGVTKPALYRHFKNKDVLMEAMSASFYDRFSDFIRADYENCVNGMDGGGQLELVLRLAFTFAEYFLRNRDDFIFMMVKAYGAKIPAFHFTTQLKNRGIDLFAARPPGDERAYPSVFQLTAATIFFMVARFHKQRRDDKKSYGSPQKNRPSQSEGRMKGATGAAAPEDELVFVFKGTIEKLVQKGLSLDREKIAALDCGALEALVKNCPPPSGDGGGIHEKLLHAVIAAIAEACPWDVTMEMVARHAGLSKSSLYSHFENRDEMIKRVFLDEVKRMEAYAKQCSLLSCEAGARLYLTVFGIVNYLNGRSDLIHVFDKLRTRKPAFKDCPEAEQKEMFKSLYEIFGHIKNENEMPLVGERETEWIMFLIINYLLPSVAARYGEVEFSDENFRRLFRFISGGAGAVK